MGSTDVDRFAQDPPLPVDLTDGLTVEEATILAVLRNPDLVALRAKRGVSRADVAAAGILPNPVLEGFAAFAGESGLPSEGGVTWEVTSFLPRAARRRAASLSDERVRLEIAWAQWRVAVEGRARFFRLGNLERLMALDSRELEVLSARLEWVRRSVELGRTPALEEDNAEDSLRLARVRAVRRENEQDRELLDIRILLGLPLEIPLRLENPPMEAQADGPEFLPDTESLVERARSERLDILALDRARAAGEERIAQATLERFPRLEIGPFVTQEAGNDGFFIGATAVLELPVLESGSAGVEAARAGRDLLEAEYEARLASVRAEVLRGVERYRVATRLRNLYAQDILPRVQEAVERARDAVESGLRDETFLLSARSRLIAVEREQASNQLELDAAWISLEAACGRVLTRGVAGAAEGAGDPAEGSS